ncbi:MAG: DUF1957 domain-containing protein [Elusimicrobiales bacterium]|jgi:1,4-alpha-glucan branching enzyme|nr:DUF1957 domain-containing protein [Elusimicrobiales bacterium]
MSAKGSLILVLHAHLPYVNHPSSPDFLEENWFFEGVVETYIPLITMLESLAKDGIKAGLTVSISPTLGAMLENESLEKKLIAYVDSRLALLEKEAERAGDREPLAKTVRLYQRVYEQAAELLRRYSGDIITPLKQFQAAGQIEIITTSATHAVLPLLPRPEALRAQIAVAAEDYEDRFNRKSSGFWLPECAYDRRLQTYLKLSGFNFVFLESHGVQFGSPSAPHGVYSPYRTPNGVAVFGRDCESSREVWSSRYGYPGDPSYREFYRDVGYDGDEEYLRPWLGGQRRPLGLKYHRITGEVDLAKKELYDPDAALERVEAHAADFLAKRMAQVDALAANGVARPVITGCYDAELFGHWWFEGPAFLESVIRRIRQDRLPVQLVTPTEHLNSCQEPPELEPELSSWGEKGYFDPWLNQSNDSIYAPILGATERMVEMANRFRSHDLTHVSSRALNQAAREVLLSQSSDWPFLLYIDSHSKYAGDRVRGHCRNAEELLSQVLEKRVDERALASLEREHALFPRLDFRIFSSASEF